MLAEPRNLGRTAGFCSPEVCKQPEQLPYGQPSSHADIVSSNFRNGDVMI